MKRIIQERETASMVELVCYTDVVIHERLPIDRTNLTGFLGEVAAYQAIHNAAHPPLPEELQMIRDTVGAKFLSHLGQIHAPLYTINNAFALPVANFQGGMPLWKPKYLMSYFVSMFDKKIMVMNTWRAVRPERTREPQAAQIDFLQIADLLTGESSRKLYPRRQRMDNIGYTGMHSEGAAFLGKMRSLITSISRDCVVFLVPADKQRERIARMAFRDYPNVVIQEFEAN